MQCVTGRRNSTFQTDRSVLNEGVGCMGAQNCRLRSCNRSNSNNVWNCNTSGQLNNNNANNAYRAAPDCAA